MHKKLKIFKFLPLAIGITVILIYVIPSIGTKISLPIGKVYDYNNILVTYIADGDTVKLEDGSWVRLIGIDTPEYHDSNKLLADARRTGKDIATIKNMGAKSYAFTKQLVDNKHARLEFDIEKRDKYNRLLAYVFLPDGTFVNAKIIEQGYGRLMTISPNLKYTSLLLSLEREAKSENRGLWGIGY